MKSIPTILENGNRRRLAWKDGSRNLLVPLWHGDRRGDLVEGRITVSAKAALSEQHTNAFLQMQAEVNRYLKEWVDWRAKKGWILQGEVQVDGPFELPTPNPQTEGDGEQRYFRVQARFKRDIPLYLPMEDYLEVQRRACIYGVDLNKPKQPVSYVPPAKDLIIDTNPVYGDPLQQETERRAQLGIAADDPMFDKVDRDWASPKADG